MSSLLHRNLSAPYLVNADLPSSRPSSFRKSRSYPFQLQRSHSPRTRPLESTRSSILLYRKALSWQRVLEQPPAGTSSASSQSLSSSSSSSSSGTAVRAITLKRPAGSNSGDSSMPSMVQASPVSIKGDRTPRPLWATRFSNATDLTDNGDASSDGYHSAVSGAASSSTAAKKLANGARGNDFRSAVRIQVSTPRHRRARSDASVRDFAVDGELMYDSSSSIASLAGELEELCSHLPARDEPPGKMQSDSLRPRSNTTNTATTLGGRVSVAAAAAAINRSADGKASSRHALAAATAAAAQAKATEARVLTPSSLPTSSTPTAKASSAAPAIESRRRSQTIGTDAPTSVRRFRASTLMHSISEESSSGVGSRSPARSRISLDHGTTTHFSPGNPSHEKWSGANIGTSSKPYASSSSSRPVSSLSSPATPDYDYIRFIDSNYGSSPTWTSHSPTGTPLTAYSDKSLSPVSRKQPLPSLRVNDRRSIDAGHEATGPSEMLAEQTAWSQEELARYSSDEEGVESPDPVLLAPHGGGLGAPECFSTPSSSPLIVHTGAFMRLPGSETSGLLGLGLYPKPLAKIASSSSASAAAVVASASIRRSSDGSEPRTKAGSGRRRSQPLNMSSLETNHPGSGATLSSRRASARSDAASQGDSLQLPSMPWRYSSLGAGRRSTDSFASTQPEYSLLFEEGGYSPSSSPMADNGHGHDHDNDPESAASAAAERGQGPRQQQQYASSLPQPQRRRPSSTDSSDSMHSTSSHASSLLLSAHPAQASGCASMERNPSVNTAATSRPTSIASSLGEKLAPGRPPRSPRRAETALAPPPPPSKDAIANGGEDSSSRSNQHGQRRSSQSSTASNRRKPPMAQRPQLPARMTSLDESVAAAPGQMQLREEFPDRLLGDFLADDAAAHRDGDGSGAANTSTSISVSPLPFNMMARSDSQTISLPGIGEIIPPSPDVSRDSIWLDGLSPPALKRLGAAVSHLERQPMTFRGAANASSASLASQHFQDRPEASSSGLDRSPSRIGNLKTRLTGRLGSSIDLVRATTSSAAPGPSVVHEAPPTTSSPPVAKAVTPTSSKSAINRFIKGGRKLFKRSKDNLGALESPRLPAAWEDRLGGGKGGGKRRPGSRMSISVESPPRAGDLFLDLDGPRRQAAMDQAAKEAPRSATPSFASEEYKGRASSSSFWRLLNPSANTSAASLIISLPGAAARAATLPAEEQPHQLGNRRSASQLSHRGPTSLGDVGFQHHQHRGFFDLSEEDDEDDHRLSGDQRRAGATKPSGRKDLSKLFGASESDLNLDMHRMPSTPVAAPEGRGDVHQKAAKGAVASMWTASLGRSSKKKQQQQQQQQQRQQHNQRIAV